MNVRMQITLDPELRRRARAEARGLGISFAEYTRRALAEKLSELNRRPDVSVFFNLGASAEPTNIARDKDKLIGEAVWEEHLRSLGRAPRPPAKSRKSRRR